MGDLSKLAAAMGAQAAMPSVPAAPVVTAAALVPVAPVVPAVPVPDPSGVLACEVLAVCRPLFGPNTVLDWDGAICSVGVVFRGEYDTRGSGRTWQAALAAALVAAI